MKRLVKLGITFANGDVIEIPRENIVYYNVCNIQTILNFSSGLTIEDKEDISEYEVAQEFEIALLKEWLDNNRIDYTDFEQDADLENAICNGKEFKQTVENLTYTQRIKKYQDFIGITQIFNDDTERSIEIDYYKKTTQEVKDDKVIIIIKVTTCEK